MEAKPSQIGIAKIKLGGKHYGGLHQVVPVSSQQKQELAIMIAQDYCNVFSKIHPVKRIGSPSQYATIWEVIIDTQPKMKAALKVQKNQEKSQEEIDIHRFLNSYPDYFLEMYDSLWCDRVELGDNEIFSNYLIILELAVADLGQYLTQKKVSERDLVQLVAQVFDSIYVLGKNQLYHGDLHVHNVFIVLRSDDSSGESYLKAVIGDFGETKGLDSITSHTSDVFRFTTSLLEFLLRFPNKYENVKNRLKMVVKYVNRRTVQLENIYDDWNEKNRDEEGNVNFEELDQFFTDQVSETIHNVKDIMLK